MDIDYNKLLDKWFEEVVKEADKMQAIMDKESYNEDGYLISPPSNKYIRAEEFKNGLYYATAILSRLESKEKKKGKRKNGDNK